MIILPMASAELALEVRTCQDRMQKDADSPRHWRLSNFLVFLLLLRGVFRWTSKETADLMSE